MEVEEWRTYLERFLGARRTESKKVKIELKMKDNT